jgi:transposase-like protein
MKTQKNEACRKAKYQKATFDRKLSVIDEIANGQISVNHASSKHGFSRSTIDYWMKKLSSFEQKSMRMSKNDEIKILRERVEELEFIKEFQQDVIADFETITGEELAKKYLPKTLAREIERRKRSRTK